MALVLASTRKDAIRIDTSDGPVFVWAWIDNDREVGRRVKFAFQAPRHVGISRVPRGEVRGGAVGYARAAEATAPAGVR